MALYSLNSFNELYYLQHNPDVVQAISKGLVASALQHYELWGEAEGRWPNAGFNPTYYEANNPDVLAAINAKTIPGALWHFENAGLKEGRVPAGTDPFNNTFYINNNPDVAAAVAAGKFVSGWQHYALYGAAEGRAPNNPSTNPEGQTFTLTTGTDIATANQFFGSLSAYNFDGKGPTLTVGDKLTGLSGVTTNTLILNDGYGQGVDIIPAGVSLANLQTVTLQTAGNAGGAGRFDTSPYSSVLTTSVVSSGIGNDQVQASGTGALSVTHTATAGGVSTFGGTSVNVTTLGNGGVNVGGTGTNELQTGNVTVNAKGSGGGAGTVTVIGGQAVAITVDQASATGNISIGNTGLAALTKTYNPTGTITVTSNSVGGVANVQTILGGTNVTVSAKGDTINIGDAAATDPSNQPSGNVSVTNAQLIAYDNLTAPGTAHNSVLGGAVTVQGGTNVSVTTNTGGGVFVGTTNVAGTYASGNVTIVDTSSNLRGANGIGGAAGGAVVRGGTAVTVTEAGGLVTIGGAVGGVLADNPKGAVTVTETVASKQQINIDGGTAVTVSAKGQQVNIGATFGTAGAQTVTQSSVYTGKGLGSSNGNSAVKVDGGTTVTVNTTGGNVTVGELVGTNVYAPTGAVSVTNKFSGAGNANASTVTVRGGTTVSVTETNTTSGAIVVGTLSGLDATGAALKYPGLMPTGDVTINNSVTNGTTTTYGKSATTVVTHGGATVSVTGAGATTITDANALTATATGKAVGTSALATVNLKGVTGAVAIKSGALTALTIEDSLTGSAAATTVDTTAGAGYTAQAAHTLALTLGNDTHVGTSVTDPTATALTVATTGTAVNNIGIVAAAATSVTFNNAAAVTVTGATLSTTGPDTVTATGAGALNLGNTTAWVGATKLTSIDANTASGAVTATIDGNVTAFKGGSGNDVVTVSTGASKAIDGGGGANTVVLNNTAASYNPALDPAGPIYSDFANFQTLGFAAGTTGVYDVSGFTAATIAGSLAALTLQKAGAGETLTYTGAPTGGVAWALKTDTAADALNVTIGVDGTTNAGIAAGLLITDTVVAATRGIETVTVNSVGKSTMTGAHTITLTDGGGATKTLNATGNAKATITDAAGTITKIAVTSTADTDVSGVVAAATGVAITGGAGKLTASTNTGLTAITSVDTLATGSGGGVLTLGLGGAGGTAGSTGSERVNLTGSVLVRDTIALPDTAPATGTGVRGIVADFKALAGANADVLTLTTAAGTQSLVNSVATVNGSSGSTYSVSNGVFTLLTAAGPVAVPATAALAELQDIKLLVAGVAPGVGGGSNKIGAVTISGTTYVVSTGNAAVGASMGATETTTVHPVAGNAEAQSTVVQLTGLSGITGFGQSAVGTVATGAANTLMLSNLALAAALPTGSAVAGSTNNVIATNSSHEALTVASTTGVTNNYKDMATWAQMDIGGAGMTGGALSVTQQGTGGTLVLHSLASSALDSVTFSNDVTLILDGTAAAFAGNNAAVPAVATGIKSLVDATNSTTTIYAVGGNGFMVGGITDTALKTIDGSKMTGGTMTLGNVDALSQDNLTIKVSAAAQLKVTASGAGDSITGGNQGDTIVATGANATILDGSGANTITATGAAATITLGNLATGAAIGTAQTIHAPGAGDTITFALKATDGTAITYTAASTVDGGTGVGIGANSTVSFGNNVGAGKQTVVITGASAGATSGETYAYTTLKNASDSTVNALDNAVTFNAITTEKTAGANFGGSQINVAGATSLAAALDLAIASAAMSQQGTADNGLAAGHAAGYIGPNTGVIDWFQYGGDTYIVEAVNNTSAAATNAALDANDMVVKIAGLVDLSSGTFDNVHTVTF